MRYCSANSRVALLLMLSRDCFVVIDACSSISFSSVSFLCAPAVTPGDDASLRSTTPSVSSSHQVRGCIYHAYNFQLTLPSYRIDRLLDPTTSYLCLSK